MDTGGDLVFIVINTKLFTVLASYLFIYLLKADSPVNRTG